MFVSRDWFPENWKDPKTGSTNNEKSYDKLGNLISDGRMAGLVDWEAIVDRTRFIRKNSHWTSPEAIVQSCAEQFEIDKWENQEVYVEVFIEKDALIGVIENVCQENDVPYLACRGYASMSEIWRAGHKRLKPKIDNGKKVIVLYLGDHDPSGIDMGNDVRNRLMTFTGASASQLEVRRIALTMDQIEEYAPPPNPTKALALETPLPTPDGWTTMGEVQVGEQLLGVDGRPTTVTGKSAVFVDTHCYRFDFAGGDSVVCSADHLWEVAARKRSRGGGVMSASKIAVTWQEGKGQARAVYSVALAAPINNVEISLPVPPYVLGAWLGDGASEGGMLACHQSDDSIREFIEKEGFRTTRHSIIRCQIYALRAGLVSLGLLHNKHIPMQYLRAGYYQRLALLQGLMDTDGMVAIHKRSGNAECRFSSSRKHLAEQFLELLCTLGIRGRLQELRAYLNGKDMGPTWIVYFYPGDMDVFRLPRKRVLLVGAVVAERQRWRKICKVSRVASVPTQCITVDGSRQLFLCGRHFIPTHNSTDSRAGKYIEDYGHECWELDALEPTVIRGLIQEHIDKIRNKRLWQDAQAEERVGRENLQRISDNWSDVVDYLEDR